MTGALHKAIRVITRPLRVGRGPGGITIQCYRGYGSRQAIFLMGRVFRQPGAGTRPRGGVLWRDLADLGRLLLRRGIGGAVVQARFGETCGETTTDSNGYFRIYLRPAHEPPADRLWHDMDIELLRPAAPVRTRGEFFVPPREARFVVISDIDDTVMHTGVASKAKMLWRLFLAEAKSRVAFPGVAALYRALHRGVSGEEFNPMLYVSRGPWSIYEMLDEFFHLHDIPVGPILFLREWGLTLQHPLPHRAKDHKLDLIRGMLSLYHDLPFVLIGDSGQHDPEIYTRIVEDCPGRVLAIYIRNVSRAAERHREIETLAQKVLDAGGSLVLAADTFVMAEHAVEHGLISPEALSKVLAERAQQGEPAHKPVLEVKRADRRETRQAVERGALKEAIEADTGEESPPNVVVEPENQDTEDRVERGQP